jgi:hypothetical protein
MRRRISVGVAAASAVAALAPVAPADASPRVDQLVVFKKGDATQQLVKAAGIKVRVGSRRCAVGAGTPLAALLHAGVPGIKLKDYGACSSRPADAAGLYVSRIRNDVAKGASGWVYKVGNRVGTAGAADTNGPFGNGRLKPGVRVTWFYCHMKASGCQRTLAIKPKALGGRKVRVTARSYDDGGKARLVPGAAVHAGDATATTDSHGVATLTVAPGAVGVRAEANGLVRSFEERIDVT